MRFKLSQITSQKTLCPKTNAYFEIWLTDEEGERTKVASSESEVEPIYGTQYLPRKFKTGIAFPEDNCTDIYSQDLGLLAIVENDSVVGYNVIVGGGLGTTPSAKKTFPAVGQKLCYIEADKMVDLAVAIVKVQRETMVTDLTVKSARMKYLIHNWGIDKFRTEVEKILRC